MSDGSDMEVARLVDVDAHELIQLSIFFHIHSHDNDIDEEKQEEKKRTVEYYNVSVILEFVLSQQTYPSIDIRCFIKRSIRTYNTFCQTQKTRTYLQVLDVNVFSIFQQVVSNDVAEEWLRVNILRRKIQFSYFYSRIICTSVTKSA
jgi:hypothetical protein